jgi:SP family myo-inositol transporter-like MFS transporter 13
MSDTNRKKFFPFLSLRAGARVGSRTRRNSIFLLLVSGLGGLLYGIDVGIIAGALPYLEATSGLNAGQLSVVVAAVLLGSVVSTLFAGALADGLGRKPMMVLSGVVFVASIPVIALAHGYVPLVLGRMLQGVSAGFIGVIVPLYLAECLAPAQRGKGTAIFQLLLTLGIVAAALIGMCFSVRIEHIAELGDADRLFAFKDLAWRSIFWCSLPPGILFVLGSAQVSESPRWLFRVGRKEACLAALRWSRTEEQAALELSEMEAGLAASASPQTGARTKDGDFLFSRKYVIPFVLACVILACTQATGVASIIGYSTTILLQAGLSDLEAHWGYVALTAVNFVMTLGSVALVDRKGRKFLLSLGTLGIIVALLATGLLFHRTERLRVDRSAQVQARVTPEQKLTLAFNAAAVSDLLAPGATGAQEAGAAHAQMLIVIYSCGGFRAATPVMRSDNALSKPLEISRENCLPANKTLAFFANPFASLDAARERPLVIENALVTPVPEKWGGVLTALCLLVFMAFYAVGPGVCVWLALSELMPTRIRSTGMSIALLINQSVSTAIAATFLPTVGKYGYAMAFWVFAGSTVVYFITATFFLPETKGKTLEEIEAYFAQRKEKEKRISV